MDVFRLSVCVRRTSRFTVDTDTEISCSGSVKLLLSFDYGNPLIIAAEESGESNCITVGANTTLDLSYDGSGNKSNMTLSCTEDAHVAQGVAFFLQNFFILLRLVFYTCTNSKPQLHYLLYTVLLYSSLEEQKKIQIAFEHENYIKLIIAYTQGA